MNSKDFRYTGNEHDDTYDAAWELFLVHKEIKLQVQNEQQGYVKILIPEKLQHGEKVFAAKEIAQKLKPLFQEKIYYKVV